MLFEQSERNQKEEYFLKPCFKTQHKQLKDKDQHLKEAVTFINYRKRGYDIKKSKVLASGFHCKTDVTNLGLSEDFIKDQNRLPVDGDKNYLLKGYEVNSYRKFKLDTGYKLYRESESQKQENKNLDKLNEYYQQIADNPLVQQKCTNDYLLSIDKEFRLKMDNQKIQKIFNQRKKILERQQFQQQQKISQSDLSYYQEAQTERGNQQNQIQQGNENQKLFVVQQSSSQENLEIAENEQNCENLLKDQQEQLKQEVGKIKLLQKQMENKYKQFCILNEGILKENKFFETANQDALKDYFFEEDLLQFASQKFQGDFIELSYNNKKWSKQKSLSLKDLQQKRFSVVVNSNNFQNGFNKLKKSFSIKREENEQKTFQGQKQTFQQQSPQQNIQKLKNNLKYQDSFGSILEDENNTITTNLPSQSTARKSLIKLKEISTNNKKINPQLKIQLNNIEQNSFIKENQKSPFKQIVSKTPKNALRTKFEESGKQKDDQQTRQIQFKTEIEKYEQNQIKKDIKSTPNIFLSQNLIQDKDFENKNSESNKNENHFFNKTKKKIDLSKINFEYYEKQIEYRQNYENLPKSQREISQEYLYYLSPRDMETLKINHSNPKAKRKFKIFPEDRNKFQFYKNKIDNIITDSYKDLNQYQVQNQPIEDTNLKILIEKSTRDRKPGYLTSRNSNKTDFSLNFNKE